MSVEIINPWNGRVEYRYDYFDDARVERVLAAADRAWPAWARTPVAERGTLLRRIGATLRARREDIAAIMAAEMGKLRRECLGEIDKSAGACDYYADHAQDYLRDVPIATEARTSYVTYEPLGCIFAVMPWNLPVWQIFRFLAPALMAGNVAVLKHAITVPRCADAIADVLRDAGAPEGLFGVLHIDNPTAARVIGDPRIKAVTLTGSERAGRSVAATAGQHLKKCVLELGGSDPLIVLEDADLDAAIAAVMTSRFGNAGQTCIAAKRLLLMPGIADAFTDKLHAAVAGLVLGDPMDDASTLAPMARVDLRDEVHRQVVESVAAGARLTRGGVPGEGACHYPATILEDVRPGMAAYHEEVFGPVACILRVADEDEAVHIANDTRYGLGASVWTRDLARGEAIARRLDAGAIFVNAVVRSDYRMPFGGTKASGYGRELAEHGIHEFMNIKTVYVA